MFVGQTLKAEIKLGKFFAWPSHRGKKIIMSSLIAKCAVLCAKTDPFNS